MIGKEFQLGKIVYRITCSIIKGIISMEEDNITFVGRKYVDTQGFQSRFMELDIDRPVYGILISKEQMYFNQYILLCKDKKQIDEVADWIEHYRCMTSKSVPDYKRLSLQQMRGIRQIMEDTNQPETCVRQEVNNNLTVHTDAGKIIAKVLPDKEYPGIALLLDKNRQPGVIMDYDPFRKCIQIRVYGKEDPDGDPIHVIPITNPT